MRECSSGERLQRCKSVLLEVSRSHSRKETSLERIKSRRPHKRTEGLNVKLREQITKFQREGVKPNHVRELYARGKGSTRK
ncbi:hypothetical protein [uncultured Cyclobacterium sp.]|uniref:hypothetical protein n=1 Tax=uncultured Cyclobacterium sp. TaxID=453820 RepID=UPI0030ED875F